MSHECPTYRSTIGNTRHPLATYVPKRVADRIIPDDPEFVTYTYGDASAKRRYLLKLKRGILWHSMQVYSRFRQSDELRGCTLSDISRSLELLTSTNRPKNNVLLTSTFIRTTRTLNGMDQRRTWWSWRATAHVAHCCRKRYSSARSDRCETGA